MEKCFDSRKLLDFEYAFQSTDEQKSDIRDPFEFRLHLRVFSMGRIKSIQIALKVSSQSLHETIINGYSRDVRYTNATIYKISLVEY